ncbi:MAG TPA: enoyl-CoA hydratase-related protein [Acidimicrobiales bacterium]
MNPSQFRDIRYEVDSGVGIITLNRPDRRNAWTGSMAVEYRWALHHADVDPGVRVVILAGEGRDFCVGAEPGSLREISVDGGSYTRASAPLPPYPDGTPEWLRHNHCATLAIGVPVIAVVTGACAGAGFVLATYSDLRWVADDAKVTSAFARLGLPAEYGTAWLLARQVGLSNAMQLLYSADVVDGPNSLRLGWAQRTGPAGEVLENAKSYARRLALHSSPQSLRSMKRALVVDAAGSLDTAYRKSVQDMEEALRHPDFRRGLDAQAGRVLPNFL